MDFSIDLLRRLPRTGWMESDSPVNPRARPKRDSAKKKWELVAWRHVSEKHTTNHKASCISRVIYGLRHLSSQQAGNQLKKHLLPRIMQHCSVCRCFCELFFSPIISIFIIGKSSFVEQQRWTSRSLGCCRLLQTANDVVKSPLNA